MGAPLMAQPLINQVLANLNQVGQYEKLELTLDLTTTYTNPYDYSQIAVSAVFTSPTGQQVAVDGFFREEFTLNSNGSLTPTGNSGFQLRFAPNEIGTWTYLLSITDVTGTTTDTARTLDCIASTVAANNGYVRTNASKYLSFDNGDPYIPIGENVAWQANNPFQDYSTWLGNMADNSGNFFRLWHAHWGLGIEWEDGWNGFEGLRKYKESNCRYQDWLFDYCADKGIYVMLALQHHGQVSSQVNPNWLESPYYTGNGGPCANTWDFFTNESARAHTKNRLRYIVARWGYSRSIMAWELFNEVDWTDDYVQHRTDIIDWHEEMATYLRQIDPYQHLITTSFARDDYEPLVWTSPDIDITQTHYYLDTPNLERLLVSGVREYLDVYDKPTLSGEFGLGPTPPATGVDPDGIHIHNGLWGALFGGGMGTAMSWWWDSYIEPEDLYYHFETLAEVVEEVPFVEKEMRPTESLVLGAPGDLSLTPSLDWGIIAEDSIGISAGGQITPENPALSQFMYGSTWNTEYRSPPTFYVDYPVAGAFTVTTGSSTGASPQLAIWLDGSISLQQNANPATSYSINVPAGPHTIKVDNTGTDWIRISDYRFTGLGSKIDAYSLIASDSTVAAGWVLSNQYNHQVVPVFGPPTVVSGATCTVLGMTDGAYFAKWYNCLTGDVVALQALTASGGSIDIPIPDLHWDLAFRVDDEVVNPTSIVAQALPEMRLYPNPARAGDEVTIETMQERAISPGISLLDVAGRELANLTGRSAGTGVWTVSLPASLPEGFYWVRMTANMSSAVRPIVVGR